MTTQKTALKFPYQTDCFKMDSINRVAGLNWLELCHFFGLELTQIQRVQYLDKATYLTYSSGARIFELLRLTQIVCPIKSILSLLCAQCLLKLRKIDYHMRTSFGNLGTNFSFQQFELLLAVYLKSLRFPFQGFVYEPRIQMNSFTSYCLVMPLVLLMQLLH